MKNGSNLSNSLYSVNYNSEFCSMCGAIEGDFWETESFRSVRLHLRPRYKDASHKWIICDECDEGLQSMI